MTGSNDVSRTALVFGTLAPTGGLTFNGNLDLRGDGLNTANTIVHVTPQAHDEVDVGYSPGGLSGGVFLGGRLSVTMTGSTFTPGMRFHLLHAAAGRGTTFFQSQSITHGINNQCILPTIQYDDVANNVDLYLCPCSGCPE